MSHRCSYRLMALATMMLAAAAQAEGIAEVAAFDGAVAVRHQGEWRAIEVGDPLSEGDELRTRNGRVRILVDPSGQNPLQNGGVLVLAADSDVIIRRAAFSPNPGPELTFGLIEGGIRWMGDHRDEISKVFAAQGKRWEPIIQVAVEDLGGHRVKSWILRMTGTDVIVFNNRQADGVAIGVLSGSVEVTGIGSGAAPVNISAGERIWIQGDDLHVRPERVELAELQKATIAFAFVGQGQRESVSRPVLLGNTVVAGTFPGRSTVGGFATPPGIDRHENQDAPTLAWPDLLSPTTGDLHIRLP
jgi:hypothetical protein